MTQSEMTQGEIEQDEIEQGVMNHAPTGAARPLVKVRYHVPTSLKRLYQAHIDFVAGVKYNFGLCAGADEAHMNGAFPDANALYLDG
jgi:hypothetical protein